MMAELIERKKSVEQYPGYKDSGVEWLGEIPEHWNILKNRSLFEERNDAGNDQLPILSVSIHTAVSTGELEEEENIRGKIRIKDKSSYKRVYPKDIALNMMRAWQGAIGVVRTEGMVSPAYIVAKPIGPVDSDYLEYQYRTSTFIQQMDRYSKGITDFRKRLYWSEFKQLITLIPPKEEQIKIAVYIDKKVTLIDKAIEIQERQIELLKSRQQVFIHDAVTRGVDSKVKLKDSGVDWIGNIPAHWKVKRLKYLGVIKYGLGQPPKEKEGGLRLIRATNVERGKIVSKDMMYVDLEDVPWERDPALKENDIIIVRSGAYTGDSAIISRQYAGSIAGYDMVFTPQGIDAQFISYVLISKYVLYDQLYLLRMRAAQPHLNAEELGQTLVLCPPLEEQIRIGQRIERYIEKTEVAILSKSRDIEKLKEYRSVLIDSAVTGKIKVC